jgi:hypothetical protein
MSRKLTAASSQYLQCLSAPATVRPFTFSTWFYSVSGSDQYLMSINDGTTSNQFGMFINTSSGVPDYLRAYVNGSSYINTNKAWGLRKWHYGCVVLGPGEALTIVLDGNIVETTTGGTFSGLDRIMIGREPGGTDYFGGYIAEAAVWNARLSKAQIMALRMGALPSSFPHGLRAYYPFGWTRTGDRDMSGRGFHLTPTNSPAWGFDPPAVITARMLDAMKARPGMAPAVAAALFERGLGRGIGRGIMRGV